ncbi:hypothetical protein U91I_00137 [alpha proteobacterium U9-1i]|nr:hypothetical protein U91I_00137 [alpha proteobacterium U9-1i]
MSGAPSKGWATLALIFGLATLAVFASFSLTASPTYVGLDLSRAVSAFQRAVEPEQVTSLFADNRMARLEAMNAVNKLDLSYFIAAYTLFVICAGAWLAGGIRTPLAAVVTVAAIVGAVGDVIETRAQIGLVEAWIAAGAPHFLPEAAADYLPIAPWHWLKYLGLGVSSVAISLIALLSTPRRWIIGVLGFTPLIGALVVYLGVSDDGRIITAPLAVFWTLLLVLAARDTFFAKKA